MKSEPVPSGSPGCLIRTARWGELGLVYGLHRTCFPHPYGFWRFIGYQLLPSGTILVAEAPGGLIGYGVGVTTNQIRPPGIVGEVISLAVLPDYRSHGIGRALLEALAGFLAGRGMGEVYLQVAVGNATAQSLYQQAGYQMVERLPRYYVNGEDAYLLKLDLPQPDEVSG